MVLTVKAPVGYWEAWGKEKLGPCGCSFTAPGPSEEAHLWCQVPAVILVIRSPPSCLGPAIWGSNPQLHISGWPQVSIWFVTSMCTLPLQWLLPLFLGMFTKFILLVSCYMLGFCFVFVFVLLLYTILLSSPYNLKFPCFKAELVSVSQLGPR